MGQELEQRQLAQPAPPLGEAQVAGLTREEAAAVLKSTAAPSAWRPERGAIGEPVYTVATRLPPTAAHFLDGSLKPGPPTSAFPDIAAEYEYAALPLQGRRAVQQLFQSLPAERHFALAGMVRDRDFNALLNHPNAQLLSDRQYLQLCETALAMYPRGLPQLRQALDTVPPYARRPLLLDVDGFGKPLLDNLHRLACSQQIAPPFECVRGLAAFEMLYELVNPGEVNQGNRGTCTVTSLQYFLTVVFPSEAARLGRGLFTPEGSATTLGGAVLQRAPTSLFRDDSGRSDHERLLQSATMELGNGTAFSYFNQGDSNRDHAGKSLGSGLTPAQLHYVCEQILGCAHDLFTRDHADKLAGLQAYAIEHRIDSTLAGLRINPATRYPPRYLLAGMVWDNNPGSRDRQHAVLIVDGPDPARVYFRNPHGIASTAAGSRFENPPRVLEDPRLGLYSMSKKDFYERVTMLLTPRIP